LKHSDILKASIVGNVITGYAYTSCLLDGGYFCTTASDKEYSSMAWFDEYDFKLGVVLSKPPTAEWKNGAWRRDFDHGIALVNPTYEGSTTSQLHHDKNIHSHNRRVEHRMAPRLGR
jgi:hypothetical protein